MFLRAGSVQEQASGGTDCSWSVALYEERPLTVQKWVDLCGFVNDHLIEVEISSIIEKMFYSIQSIEDQACTNILDLQNRILMRRI